MEILNYVSMVAMPLVIFFIIGYSFFEKNKVYDIFLEGAKEGISVVYNIFPTLVGLFVAVGALRSSGILDLIFSLLEPIIEFFKIPKEIMPLAILRPISGSASMAIATDIMNNFGVDTMIGKIASIIMGSTETTFYTIAVYTSCISVKKTRGILFAALAGDIIGMIVSIIICNIVWGIIKNNNKYYVEICRWKIVDFFEKGEYYL